MRYSLYAASAFFFSVTRLRAGLLDRIVFWAGLVAPAVAYWTCMVVDVKDPAAYHGLLLLILSVLGMISFAYLWGTRLDGPYENDLLMTLTA